MNNNSPQAKGIITLLNDFGSIFRFSQSRLIFPETLLQHLGEVALLGGYIMDICGDFSDAEYGKFMRRALIHDMEEVITGDIIRATKYANPELNEKLKDLEKLSAREVILTYGMPTGWYEEWEKAKDGELGWILKVADSATVLMTCHREIGLSGNSAFKKVAFQVLDNTEKLLNELQSKFVLDINRNTYQKLHTFLHELYTTVSQEVGKEVTDELLHRRK